MGLSRALAGAAIGCVVVACSGAGANDATPNPDGAIEGSACTVGFDCRSGLCEGGTCAPSEAAASGDPNDGIKNGDETDVDCGGSRADECSDGKSCLVAGDCTSGVCKSGRCAAPRPDDGVKNGDETDVDCGGKKAPKCAVGKACGAHGDCASDGCSYAKKCVEYKGCTARAGGDTCGEGETGAAGSKHESCCAAVSVTDRPAGQGGPFSIDKFHVTAGRMRAMIERYDGNLKKWAAESPTGWNDAWTASLPGTMAEALFLLGPGRKRGCSVQFEGGRTYWQGPIDGSAAERQDFTREVLDEKGLNCVPWHLAQAVCAWDGGRLASAAEIQWVFENRGRAQGATTYPWQWNDGAPYDPNNADMRLVHQYSYQTPSPPPGMRIVNGQYPLDHAFFVAPPGRRPAGASMHGVHDAAGNLLTWVRDGQKQFVYTMSWEKHTKQLTPSTWNASDGPDAYYAIGARCAR
ncbi:MAG: hypothetical protein KF819_11340 [Labilithrix sp.]|nr:hypothetical protein [Labilithrix sp.]